MQQIVFYPLLGGFFFVATRQSNGKPQPTAWVENRFYNRKPILSVSCFTCFCINFTSPSLKALL